MDKHQIREIIARRVAQEFKNGDVVNLGIGLPTAVASYVTEDQNITFQSENGILGAGGYVTAEQAQKNLFNAGGQPISVIKGASYFDSATCFAMIRGGHLDMTVLGALQVDEKGDIANWIVPNKLVPGMGGAMDLVVGAKKVIVAMEHTANGKPKILKKCELPLTAMGAVDKIITEKCVISVTDKGLVLDEVFAHSSIDDVIANTEANLIINNNLIDSQSHTQTTEEEVSLCM